GELAARARLVVVRYEDVDAQLPRPRDLLDGRDRAVGGDDQIAADGVQPLDGGRAEAVAVAHAAREEPAGIRPEETQRAQQDGGRRDAVAVVVAVDDDPRATLDVPEHERDGGVDAGELRSVVRLVGGDELPRRRRVTESATDQYLGQSGAHAELMLE